MDSVSKIYFLDNPYPDGHKIDWSVEKAAEMFRARLAGFEAYEFVDLNPKSNKREYKLDKLK
ncbi:hypothetical protein [Chryseobacterium flavum]|uniref:hypothetical protein n=1 Tax=Chryseobacterium flavum TaxID=415851 RepID=UPI0028B181E3|nr:hypothetical protein [Chryseobacterium flavum]